MKPSVVSHTLRMLVVRERQPVFIWGPPGSGKSAVVYQLAAELGIALRDIRALLLDPVDLRGLPFVDKDGRSKWATPDFLPQDGEGILFLDELNAAPAMVQASCYQLVLDRELGEYTLPEGWAIVAAGNRDSDRAASAPESALGRRGESPLQVNVTCNRLQLRRGDTGWRAAGGERPVRRITNSIRPAWRGESASEG